MYAKKKKICLTCIVAFYIGLILFCAGLYYGLHRCARAESGAASGVDTELTALEQSFRDAAAIIDESEQRSRDVISELDLAIARESRARENFAREYSEREYTISELRDRAAELIEEIANVDQNLEDARAGYYNSLHRIVNY